MRFRAQLQAMADSEIIAIVPAYYLEQIKQRDPKPMLKAFVVGQEGTARATLVGYGKVVKTWFKDAIKRVSNQLYAGMKLFAGHEFTNTHDGRIEVGEIAGSRSEIIDGKFSALMVAYIYPEHKDKLFNVASIEVDVNLDTVDGDVHAINIGEVTAVALGDSRIDKPGFPGAEMIGAMQAFVDKNKNNIGGDVTTIKEVKRLIAEEDWTITDLFSKKAIKEDEYVIGHVEAAAEAAKDGVKRHLSRTDEKFESESDKWEKEKAELEKENKRLRVENSKTKSDEVFAAKAKERNLTEQQIEFIDYKKKIFKPSGDEDKLGAEVNEFLDKNLVDFKQEAKIFGIKIEDPPPVKDKEKEKEDLTIDDDKEDNPDNAMVAD